MVCGLAWRCCIKRWVKKRCKSGAKVVEVIIADPPSDARAGAWLLASAPESRLNTTACPRRGHDRGRRTRSAGGVLDLGWTDTTLPACWLRIGVSCHADVARDGRICRADRSAGTTHRKFDESLRHPNDCPSWKRTDRRRPLVPPNDVCVARCRRQVLCTSMRAKARVETCQTCRCGSSAPPPSGPSPEVRDCALRRDLGRRHSIIRTDNGKSKVAVCWLHNDRTCRE